MAPRKRKAEGQAVDVVAPAVGVEKRVTRGSVKRAHLAEESEPVKEEGKGRKKGGRKKRVMEMVENGEEKAAVAEEGVNGGGEVAKGKTVVIEHW